MLSQTSFDLCQDGIGVNHFLTQEKIFKSNAWKMAIFQGKFQPGFFKFRVENGHFPSLDFSNSGWKMAIFQAWIFQIPGGKWPFSKPGFFKFRVENSHFPGLDFANSGWKMVIFHAWIFQSLSNKILSFGKNDIKSIKAPCEGY